MSATEEIPTTDRSPSADVSLGQIVLDRPDAAELFERLGLDYCCGGSQTLAVACAERGLDSGTVLVLLESLADSPRGTLVEGHDVSGSSIAELCDHIVAEHHEPLRTNLERSSELVATVLRVHGGEHPELTDLARIYTDLSQDFLEHANREEELLFPFCRKLESDTGLAEIDPELLGLLEDEHSATGQALTELRQLSHDYDPAGAFCATHRAMMASLQELELDTHQHVHEENNLLFPMVRTRLAATGS